MLKGNCSKERPGECSNSCGYKILHWTKINYQVNVSGSKIVSGEEPLQSCGEIAILKLFRVTLIPIPLLVAQAITGTTSAVREIPVTGVKAIPSAKALANALAAATWPSLAISRTSSRQRWYPRRLGARSLKLVSRWSLTDFPLVRSTISSNGTMFCFRPEEILERAVFSPRFTFKTGT